VAFDLGDLVYPPPVSVRVTTAETFRQAFAGEFGVSPTRDRQRATIAPPA
jgi:hypothetical protein